MKKIRWIAACVLITFLPHAVFAGSVPYIPATVSPFATALTVATETPAMLYASRLSSSSRNFTGNVTENMMRLFFNNSMASGKVWYPLDPGSTQVKPGGAIALLDPSKSGRAGFDGLYVQFDKRGNPSGVMVAESKFGSSHLGDTKYDGRQMSDKWIRRRASKTAEHYGEISLKVDGIKPISRSSLVPSSTSKEITVVPLPKGQKVFIWHEKGLGYVYYSDKPVDLQVLAKQVNKIGQYMEGVARGKIEPRKVLWRLRVKKNSFVVTSEHLDAKGNTIPGTVKQINVLSKPYAELSPSHKALVDEAVTSAIREQYGNSSKREIAMRDYKTAKEQNRVGAFLKKHNLEQPRWPWRLAGKIALKAGAWGAIMGLGFHVLNRLFSGEAVNFHQMTKEITLSAVSAAGGALAGAGISYFVEKQMLTSSQSLLATMYPRWLKSSRLLGGLGGGIIATLIFSYGYALLNGGRIEDGNRMFLTGIASSVVASIAGYAAGCAILQTAVLVGTASTGTAISALSGVAATNAALAWLGGGAVSAGGWGVALGSVVLSGGVLLLASGAAILTSYLLDYGWQALDERDRMERLEALLNAY